MPFHFACSRGHEWGEGEGEAVPIGILAPNCPVCGGAGSVIPQLELGDALDFSAGGAQATAVCVDAPATILLDKPQTLPGDKRKRVGKWRVVVGAILALTVIAGMVFSLVHGQKGKKRDRHLSQGLELFQQKDYEQALVEYTEAIRLDPACAVAYANRASIYFNQGELDKAINDCDRALELDAKLMLAYANRAGAYLNKGELDRAIADCTRAIELDPQSALAFANRGAAHLNKGELDAAIDDCSRALELSPQSSLAYANRGAAYFNKGDFDRAIADCSQAVANDPSLSLSYLNRAAAFLAKGDNDGAISDCTRH